MKSSNYCQAFVGLLDLVYGSLVFERGYVPEWLPFGDGLHEAAHYLPAAGLRELVHDVDLRRLRYGAEVCPDPYTQLLSELLARREPLLQDHECDGDLALDGVWDGYD